MFPWSLVLRFTHFFTASWLGTRNLYFLGRCWSPVSFPKLHSKHQFWIQLCFGSSVYLWKEGTYPTPGHFLCTSSYNVKMQITVKHGADINSVLTLHPFCCEDLLFSSPFGPFYFFPCLTYFYEREFFYWPPFCWVPSPSTKSLLVAFLQPFCVCLETFIHFHPCILSQAQHLLPCSGPSLLVMI